MMPKRNPDFVPPELKTWMGLWRHLKGNNLHKEIQVRLKWIEEYKLPRSLNEDQTITITEASYDVDYIKLKAFAEIESKEPPDWDEEILHQAFGVAACVKEMMRADKLSDWLIKTATKERERIYNDRR